MVMRASRWTLGGVARTVRKALLDPRHQVVVAPAGHYAAPEDELRGINDNAENIQCRLEQYGHQGENVPRSVDGYE
jgi:hypothetical protein